MSENNQIMIYTAPNGETQIDVRLQDDTVWLTQRQMEQLFDTDRTSIVRHIKNIIKDGELAENSTCAKIAQVQTEGTRTITRHIKYYNLDMILSVGYRVTSKTATQFRIWATKTLKEYLTQGFVVNQRLLTQQRDRVAMLQHTLDLITRSITNQAETLSQAQDLGRLMGDFVRGLGMLDDYDHQLLDNKGKTSTPAVEITADEFLAVVDKMRGKFASDVFAVPKDDSFYSSIGQIYQTFDGAELYPTLEEKAAMLLYLIVKNHSFIDGNKRIGASCFIYFLDKNKMLYNDSNQLVIDNSTLFALTLLVAESNPAEKETIKQVLISVLNRNK